ncbi:protein of unknown function [Roseivivax halotolerans]|jgi:uncharacterized protein YjiS (DUF1127 family)|uniref:YjiS-like domain-containing protein n=1 Tax=Roseivivax halotolerans TaxID=93684 RepID=A0A1I5YAV0_9RHOB|nr:MULTISPECIES: DUF1127 domain-containing protein [Roseivivax]QFT63835.1 hypothetical protein FIU91_12925 [Roseivivax sp. THAF30]SFQ41250.1 protein of unknown function [Roseivivax halotolerans]
MAYTNTQTQSRFSGLLATISEDLRARMERRRVFNQTVSELSQLSNRELADLGLNRSMIRTIAWQAAQER